MSKKAILRKIDEARLLNEELALIVPKPTYKEPMILREKDLYAECMASLRENKAIVIETSKEGLKASIDEIVASLEAKSVLFSEEVDRSLSKGIKGAYYYDSCVEEIRDKLFDSDTAVFCARCGVADIGVVGLASGKNAPRLSSLIVDNTIILLRKEDIVENMCDAIYLLASGDVLPTNMLLVAGPSRTADVELVTVFGVHGPRVVYVVVY